VTRNEVLDNITLYWLTNTGISASRLYWEYKGGFFNTKGVNSPVAVTVFPSEQYRAPRSWAERAHPNLIYSNKVGRGGHFAAWDSRSSSPPRCGLPSGHCANDAKSSALSRCTGTRLATGVGSTRRPGLRFARGANSRMRGNARRR
jgi:hypothetical protein